MLFFLSTCFDTKWLNVQFLLSYYELVEMFLNRTTILEPKCGTCHIYIYIHIFFFYKRFFLPNVANKEAGIAKFANINQLPETNDFTSPTKDAMINTSSF